MEFPQGGIGGGIPHRMGQLGGRLLLVLQHQLGGHFAGLRVHRLLPDLLFGDFGLRLIRFGGRHYIAFILLIISVMSEFPINRGIGKSVEFKGLKAQYLFIFIGGLLAVFILFIIMYLVGINQWFCIGFGLVAASVLVWQTFALNAKYGEHGFMKVQARSSHPKYIINRRKIPKLFKKRRKK